MQCSEHPREAATSICLVCGRGLCRECGVQVGSFLVCRYRCEIVGKQLSDLREFSTAQPVLQNRILSQARLLRTAMGAFVLVVGVLVMLVGYLHGPWHVFGPVGGVTVCFGLAAILMGRRAPVQTANFRLCRRCGYNMTANTTGICPECGATV